MSEGEGRVAGPSGALAEALEQQAATNEILRVIARSRGDAQPVFDTIVAAAQALCDGSSTTVATFDGRMLHMAALANVSAEGARALRASFPRPLGSDTAVSRAVLSRRVVMIDDVLLDAEYQIQKAATL